MMVIGVIRPRRSLLGVALEVYLSDVHSML